MNEIWFIWEVYERGPCEVSYAHLIGFIDGFAVYSDEYSNI